MDLKQRIEKLLSEILSDQHDMNITLKFEKKVEENEQNLKLCG